MLIIIYLLIIGFLSSLVCCTDIQEEIRGQIITVLIHFLSIVLILGWWKKFEIPSRIFLVIIFVLNTALMVFALLNINDCVRYLRTGAF